jgi:Ser-tRNA(Ala) deacylase AlaX
LFNQDHDGGTWTKKDETVHAGLLSKSPFMVGGLGAKRKSSSINKRKIVRLEHICCQPCNGIRTTSTYPAAAIEKKKKKKKKKKERKKKKTLRN